MTMIIMMVAGMQNPLARSMHLLCTREKERTREREGGGERENEREQESNESERNVDR